ncbi:MAG: hypothetical protein HYZ28_06775 [Myxococcales bacterium]|nr:hypothetical protein [Myxococcales bacterium]
MNPGPAPPDIADAIREAVRQTLAGTVRAWVEQATEGELRSDEVRQQLRPLILQLVRKQLEEALRASNGKRRRRRR